MGRRSSRVVDNRLLDPRTMIAEAVSVAAASIVMRVHSKPVATPEHAQMKHTHYIRQSYLFCMYRNYVLDIKKYLIGRRVLEVGPNKGYLFEKYYPQTKSYTLVEPNQHFEKYYVKLQKRHPNLHYKISGFETFASEEKFDTIVMMAVISHIRMDSKDIVDKIDSMLNPDGYLIVETNNSKRNLEVFDLCDKKYEKVEVKASYDGIMRRLKIDYRDVLIYRKA
jgi:2-polyprenyl-3-methyl-5-hydroxy-6-metoxy-1,4-benzoquinol methylase